MVEIVSTQLSHLCGAVIIAAASTVVEMMMLKNINTAIIILMVVPIKGGPSWPIPLKMNEG